MSYSAQSLPLIHASGSHYDVGFAVGSTFATRILSYWNQSKNIQDKLVPFYDCRKGRELFDVYLRGAELMFPQYVSEIKGTAQGAGISFEKLFLLNISKAIYNYHYDNDIGMEASKAADDTGCTTVFVNRPDFKLLAHTEDCDPTIGPYGYMVSARIRREIEPTGLITCDNELFTAYAYPGTLPGNAFGFNGHGLVLTVNGQYPDFMSPGAPTRHFISRAMLTATSIDDGFKIAGSEYGSANGFTANIASISDTATMASIEVCPGVPATCHVTLIPEVNEPDKPCHYIHANAYKHLVVKESDNLASAVSRMKRASEMPPPRTVADVKRILGDTEYPVYPIYRNSTGLDSGKTVATCFFDMMGRKLEIYLDNPKLGNAPLITLPLTSDIAL